MSFFRAAFSEHPFSYYICVHRRYREIVGSLHAGEAASQEGADIYGRKRTTIRLRGRVIPSSIFCRMETSPRCARVLRKAVILSHVHRITRKFSRDRAHELPHRSRPTRAGVLSGARKQILAYRGAWGRVPELLIKRHVSLIFAHATFAPFL